MTAIPVAVPWARPLNGKYLLVQAVSLFRLPAGIFVILATARGVWWPLASVLLLLGLATDFIDGYLARLWDVTSQLGAINDAHMDRFLLISPLVGMGCYGDVPLAVSAVLATGLYLADAIADHFEIMRVVWWPLCYLAIGYGLFLHASAQVMIGVGIGFATVSAIIIATHLDEVRRVWKSLRS